MLAATASSVSAGMDAGCLRPGPPPARTLVYTRGHINRGGLTAMAAVTGGRRAVAGPGARLGAGAGQTFHYQATIHDPLWDA
jgi:hypothetical protein